MHEDNVTYSWLHANLNETRDRPRRSAWKKQIKQLKVDTKALKKYKAKLRKAKAEVYTNRYDVYGTACLDPIATLAVVRARVSS